MPSLVERSLIRFGESGLVVCIPKPFADYYRLRPGEKVEVIVGDGELVVRLKRPLGGGSARDAGA